MIGVMAGTSAGGTVGRLVGQVPMTSGGFTVSPALMHRLVMRRGCAMICRYPRILRLVRLRLRARSYEAERQQPSPQRSGDEPGNGECV